MSGVDEGDHPMIRWLYASIDRIERAAECASERKWALHYDIDPDDDPEAEPTAVIGRSGLEPFTGGVATPGDVVHIALHDPFAVLQRLRAERALIALHPLQRDNAEVGCGLCVEPWPCSSLRWIAWGHVADTERWSSGWLDEWAPTGT